LQKHLFTIGRVPAAFSAFPTSLPELLPILSTVDFQSFESLSVPSKNAENARDPGRKGRPLALPAPNSDCHQNDLFTSVQGPAVQSVAAR
jgi:hypothetical protein